LCRRSKPRASNEGCTPTKTMVASARVAYLARRGTEYGVDAGNIHVDMERVRWRKRDIVDRFRNSSQRRIEKTANLDLVAGEASFTSPKSMLVRLKDGGQRLEDRPISRQHVPPVLQVRCKQTRPQPTACSQAGSRHRREVLDSLTD